MTFNPTPTELSETNLIRGTRGFKTTQKKRSPSEEKKFLYFRGGGQHRQRCGCHNNRKGVNRLV